MTWSSAPTRILTLTLLGLGLLACPPPPPAVTDAGEDAGTEVIDAGCAGRVGCECAAGSCTTGECIGGTCVDCRRGEAACSCRANGTCNAGLRCAASRCESCPAGEQSCACGTGGTCNTGLVCANGVCAPDTCVAGTESCPCRSAGTACDATLYCDGSSLCRTCSNDVVGCPCSAGACLGNTVCDGTNQVCRAPRTCAQLSCLPNQLCTEASNGADAQCVPMTCLPQFKWDGAACVACVSQDCLAEPSCSDVDGGLGSTCLTQSRECLPGLVARCGACLQGFSQNSAGVCVPLPTCGAVTCAVTEYCDRSGVGGIPRCTAIPCPAGQAMSNGGVCTPCQPNPTCTATGFSGRTWPIKTTADVCLCETLDDYFIIAGGLVAATACDADGDGWVRQEAGDPLVDSDPAFRANMRCDITRVTRARLFDEYGASIDVLSCTEGLVKASVALPDGGTPNGGLPLFPDGGLMNVGADAGCTDFVPLRLLETPRNDIPGNPAGSNRAPVYGGTAGRLLEAAELNSLTKACASLSGDYNDNQLDDIREYQGEVAPIGQRPAPAPDRVRLESFSYFLELDTAWAADGVLNIRERSRCEAAFPFHYEPDAGSDQYTLASDKPYWRTCSRGRDSDYGTQRPGFDFGQYECAAQTLSCPLKPPPHPSLIAPADPRTTLFRDFGLCRMGGNPPADGLWRGMNHHSQFKCVNVVTGTPVNAFDKQPAEFGLANGLLTFNTCNARPCSQPGALDCTTPQGTTGAQTRQPVLDCAAQPSQGLSGQVGFAAVNYRPYRFADTLYSGNTYTARLYERGCVNEDDAWWDFLCPNPEFVLSKDLADAQFGRYSCYKFGSNFVWGGPSNAGDRSTLRWGANSNASVFGPRPPPDGGL